MEKIDIGLMYTVLISLVMVISITWFNLVRLERTKGTIFGVISKLNEIYVMVAAIYFILFSYEAVENYEKFVIQKGDYDKYAIAFCIYYGISQIAILAIYKIIILLGRNRRMVKK